MPDRHLCEAPRCAVRGQHAPDCGTDGCVGCLPREAAPGLRLCDRCTDRLAADIDACPALHADLALVLAASERPGERVSGGLGGSLSLNERATHARHAVRHELVSWALLVASERGVGTPADRPRAIAVMLGRHVQWLSAHPAAGECADGFAETVALARRVAYPTGARVFVVGPCPAQVDDAPACPGTIRAILRNTGEVQAVKGKAPGLPNMLICDEDDAHQWDQKHWIWLGRQMWAAWKVVPAA